MLVKNVTEVTLKCREFGVKPFDIAPGEVKDVPEVVAKLWASMSEKPIEIVGDQNVEVIDEDPVEEDAEEDVNEDDGVEEDAPEQGVVLRKRNRR